MFWIKVLVLTGLVHVSLAINSFSLKFDDALLAQRGLGWPHNLQVTKGHEALMKLLKTLDNEQSCHITTPTGENFDISSPNNNRFERWGDECSLRVKNVTPSDEGRWRLVASDGKDSVVGWIELHVTEDTSSYSAPPIELYDGTSDVKVDLSSLNNSYCLVAKPFSESALVPGHCSVTLDRTTRAVQGNWDVLLGLPGMVSELSMKRHVVVEAEHLDVGYVHDSSSNKLHIYCNILHTKKNITFCRFQRTSQTYGYNVIDGLSDGSHSYYGKGFAWKQCGVTVERPTQSDYGTWRCTLGVRMWVGNRIEEQPPMQALISVAPKASTRRKRDTKQGESKAVFVQEDGSLKIMCQADISLVYCWFQHPNGSQFTPLPLTSESQMFWYTGEGTSAGECGITFNHVRAEDSGTWRCHMGPRGHLGVEITDDVEVRVTGPLAANRKEMNVSIGEPATLYCHTSNGNRPLAYCRFLSPTYVGINIDSSVTEQNAILGRYYFTPGRNLDIGDCSLTISSIEEQDIGEWTCAAIVDDEIMESRDKIRLFVAEAIVARRQAGVIGFSVGLGVLVVIFIGYVVYKRGPSLPLFRRQQNAPPSEGFSLYGMSTNPPSTTGSRSSQSSTESASVAQSARSPKT
ncbi:uncharacterized protein LOC119833358 [Zerene cesonia]|uniref:uncharacterized protein LOC119833358 n=1 Tax=Zerene cesonia TaxID=33412 RepID=UPI0018E587F4|nr:uncharacterized protein LOC119833358 [Zerene cesonia]